MPGNGLFLIFFMLSDVTTILGTPDQILTPRSHTPGRVVAAVAYCLITFGQAVV